MTNSQRVFVLDRNKQPLMPCHPQRARELLTTKKAAVFRRFPFTIILKHRTGGETQPVQIKIDPGSKTTGLAVVADFKRGKKVLWGAELQHRSFTIKSRLESRRNLRSARRNRKLRYRPARFLNRTKPKGWLPPSLMHRVLTTDSWVGRLSRWTPASLLSMELVKFDTQAIQNPEISGVEYQRGTLFGTEVRNYLLQKFGHRCAYCGAKDVPLEIEHIHPRSKGGSDRISNLTIACVPCNQKKGNKLVEQFLMKKPELLKRILGQAKAPLKDAAAVNSTRWKLFEDLKAYGFPVETGTGGRTKYNRTMQGLPKAHWVDAACVGESGAKLRVPTLRPLQIKCMGRGNRQMCRTDKYGFPVQHRTHQKIFYGFQTGDIVKATIPSGKYGGTHTGRIAVRARPSFLLGKFDVHVKYLQLIQRSDGYSYSS